MTKIAYLVNQYPKVSHSFIRREIKAVESNGIEVYRFSIRSCAEELVDQDDRLELEKTKFILDVGIFGLLFNLFRNALTNPVRLFAASLLTVKIGLGKDKGILIHLAYLAEACVLRRWLAASKVTHLHAHFASNSTTVAMLCNVLGGPKYSFTVHGPEPFDKPLAISLNEKIKRSSFVVAISLFCKSQIYRWCDHSYWSKVHLIRCGLDEDFLNQSPTLAPNNLRLVCIGRLAEQKGHLILIEAVKQLVSEGLQLKLILVGDGLLRFQIENFISELGLNNYIEITGWLSNSEVRQQILDSRLMVLPSFAEGLPVSIMEALALNRPAIATQIAGIPELLDNQTCGLLVAPGSVEELSLAIKKVLYLPKEQLEQMGKIGVERIKKYHNIEIEANKLVNLFTSPEPLVKINFEPENIRTKLLN